MGRADAGRIALSVLWKILRLVIILGLCYVILYPFFVKAVNAFKSEMDFMDPTVRFIPRAPTMEFLNRVFNKMNYFKAVFNTFIVSFLSAVLQTAVCSLSGYGFARFKFWGNGLIFMLVILTLIVPPQTMMMPLFVTFANLKLLNSVFPTLILSATGMGLLNGLFIFMYRQYYRNIPKELEEAAYIDGCGAFSTFRRIIAPSTVAITVTVFLLSFTWQWTDTFYSGLFYRDMPILANAVKHIGDPESLIVSPVLKSSMVNTAAMLAVLPVIILYIFAQKLFIQSIERSGIVG